MLLAGCGGGTDLDQLLPVRQQKVAHIRQAFFWTVRDGREYQRTLDGVDYLIRLCRKDPDRTFIAGDGVPTMRQLLEEGADTLREFRPDLAAKLDKVADNDCR